MLPLQLLLAKDLKVVFVHMEVVAVYVCSFIITMFPKFGLILTS